MSEMHDTAFRFILQGKSDFDENHWPDYAARRVGERILEAPEGVSVGGASRTACRRISLLPRKPQR